MIQPIEVQRDSYGYWTHPDYLAFCDGREYIPNEEFKGWMESQGLEWSVEYRDEEMSDPDVDGADLSNWNPESPAGDGWFVGSIHDSDDGAVCIWLRATCICLNSVDVMNKYYVSGCRDDGEATVTCEDSEATFWTLYARDEKGLSQGIIDLAFREDAEAALAVYIERDALQEQVQKLAAENAGMKSGPQGFFAYGTECGYEEFDTSDQAIAFAEGEIDHYRGEACDGWSDEVGGVVWGIVMQRATQTGLRPVDEGDNISGDFKEWCDYTLLPKTETPATDAVTREIQAAGFPLEGE